MARILVTGSTDGIGLETVRRLQGLGHNVVFHARSAERAATLNGTPEVLVADLASLEQTRSGDGDALVTGRYFKWRQELRPNPVVHDRSYQDGLLHACADLSGVALPF
jgi:NAD(P)-dependent dehydrogenase (short-subunit alcohol dehydrogenase family)